jgi:transposase
MKSKRRKPGRKRNRSGKRPIRNTRRRSRPLKPRGAKRSTLRRVPKVARNPREADLQRRVFRALRRMREEGESLSKATKVAGVKPQTFIRHARRALRRTGPGKPWKAIPEDQLSAAMKIITRFGPTVDIVRSWQERELLGRYNQALRMFRAGEDGAAAALRVFRGKTVAGHKLVTDIDLLIQLEEAGKLDFDDLYSYLGGRE